MADRFWGRICIGGPVPAELVESLCDVIAALGAELDTGVGDFQPKSADCLLNAVDEDHLELFDHHAPFGEFPELEEFLRENDIPYDRRSEGKYEYDPELVMFRPGRDPVYVYTTQDGNPVMDVAPVECVRDNLRETLQSIQDQAFSSDLDKLLRDVVGLAIFDLCGVLPPDVPPLPPFEIVES